MIDYPTSGDGVFLAAVLDNVIFGGQQFLGVRLAGWVPNVVYEELWRREVTADETVTCCINHRLLEEMLALVISNLHRDWELLKADRKRRIISLIKQHRLELRFQPYMLKLSAADKEALSIPFDDAEFLYEQEKQRLFADAYRPDGSLYLFRLGSFPEVVGLLIELLQKKHDYDISAVRYGAPKNIRSHMKVVQWRCNSEYLDLLVKLRESVTELVTHLEELNDRSEFELSRRIEATLQPFREQVSALEKRFSSSIKDEQIYKAVADFAVSRDNKRRTFVDNRKQTFTGQTLYNDRGLVKDVSLNQDTANTLKNIDMVALAHELESLRRTAKQRANSAGEYEDLAAIAAAEEAAKGGDRSKTASKLASIGKWALELARETGIELAAKVISAQIGGG